MEISKRSFFNPIKLTAAQKAAGTHETAMRIIDDEVTAREPKLRDFASCGRRDAPKSKKSTATTKIISVVPKLPIILLSVSGPSPTKGGVYMIQLNASAITPQPT